MMNVGQQRLQEVYQQVVLSKQALIHAFVIAQVTLLLILEQLEVVNVMTLVIGLQTEQQVVNAIPQAIGLIRLELVFATVQITL